MESARACGAGIDDQPARTIARHQSPMGVTEDEHVAGVSGEQLFGRRTSELISVADMNEQPAHRDRPFARQPGIVPIVDVAGYRLDGSDGTERVEHVLPADVAGMENQVDMRQNRDQLGPHQTVRVRDQPDHASLQRHRGPGSNGAARYRRIRGAEAATQIVAIRQPTPPLTTEKGAPSQFATVPASSSPNCGPPMKNTMLMPVMRPRRRSGVSS